MPFADTLMQGPILLAAAAVLILVLLAGVSLVLFRRRHKRRVHAPDGFRPDRSRLGIVEVFDLDPQRQLLIVRCDDVEHLVMVGGPNDLVLETGIKREAGRKPRTPAVEAEAESDALEGAGAMPVPAEFDLPRPLPGMGPLAPKAQPARTGAPVPPAATAFDEGSRPVPPPFAGSTQRPPLFPVPPRRVPPPIAPLTQRAAQHREATPPRGRPQSRLDDRKTEAQGVPLGPRAPAGPLVRPPAEGGEPAAQRATAPDLAEPTGTATPSQPVQPSEAALSAVADLAAPSAAAASPDGAALQTTPARAAEDLRKESGSAADPIDMLEAEMAQLLGRKPGS